MTDRELLELAAKAANLNWVISGDSEFSAMLIRNSRGLMDEWDPLSDDGDALRLAVKVGIEISNYHQYGRACASIGYVRGIGEFWEINPDDHCAATRRAIVHAAAHIGGNTQ